MGVADGMVGMMRVTLGMSDDEVRDGCVATAFLGVAVAVAAASPGGVEVGVELVMICSESERRVEVGGTGSPFSSVCCVVTATTSLDWTSAGADGSGKVTAGREESAKMMNRPTARIPSRAYRDGR